MTEYERAQQRVARKLMEQGFFQQSNYVKRNHMEMADQILSLDGIEIRADDESLPSVRNAVNKSYNDYMLGQEDMLKAGFVKVISKRNKEAK